MNFEIEMKENVRVKYDEIAKESSGGCGCGSSCGCSTESETDMRKAEYEKLDGYIEEADCGLGCGVPTVHARIKEGKTVLDLGSGAGNDAFIARKLVGESGKVIGVDFSKEMINKARAISDKYGYNNVEFRQGEIENLPVADQTIDIILSNCVLNLVPNKKKAFSEMARVLNERGHFCVSDIVIEGEMPEKWKKSVELYAGCVSGAIQQDEYLNIVSEAGFKRIEVTDEKEITVPDKFLQKYLTPGEIEEYKSSGLKIKSVTVLADKRETECDCGPACC